MRLNRLNPFVLRRLHSLSGVLPVGVFLIVHLWTNARALVGRDAYFAGVDEIQHIPLLPLVEIAGIGVPLAYHAIYGVIIAFGGKGNTAQYPYLRNWLYSLQRISGFVALAFILFHLWEYRVQKAFFGMASERFYDALTENLSSTRAGVPLVALAYVVGLLGTVFHFANGLWGFCVSWGITASRASQRRAAYAFAALGLALFFVGCSTILHFATGSP